MCVSLRYLEATHGPTHLSLSARHSVESPPIQFVSAFYLHHLLLRAHQLLYRLDPESACLCFCPTADSPHTPEPIQPASPS